MKKCVIVPDSFKGTVSSSEICHIISEEALKIYPDIETVSIPVADGGEGSVDCFLEALDGSPVTCTAKGPLFENITAKYGLVDGGKTAIIEMAACAGLPLVLGKENPKETTTYGVGQLILDAAKKGVNRIVIGLGGSATNDGGCGAAAAIGVKFYDKDENSFIPCGGTLKDIARISTENRNPALDKIDFVTMCDIDNPMYGENGAAYVFAPQKGADKDDVKALDNGLKHLASIIKRDLGKDVAQISGGGAAGGMGVGMVAFFNSQLKMGIDTVLDMVDFENLIKDADLILTGEGKIDSQSMGGKVVIGVSRRAKPFNIPVVAIVGDIGDGAEAAYNEGVAAIFSTNRIAADFSVIKGSAKDDLRKTVYNLFHFLNATKF